LLSRIITFQVNRQNPDRGVTVVDFGVMIGLIAVVVIVATAMIYRRLSRHRAASRR